VVRKLALHRPVCTHRHRMPRLSPSLAALFSRGFAFVFWPVLREVLAIGVVVRKRNSEDSEICQGY
jgi:hypothetical protein